MAVLAEIVASLMPLGLPPLFSDEAKSISEPFVAVKATSEVPLLYLVGVALRPMLYVPLALRTLLLMVMLLPSEAFNT